MDFAGKVTPRTGLSVPACSCTQRISQLHRIGREDGFSASGRMMTRLLGDPCGTQLGWDPGFPHEDLTQEQYEKVWIAARRSLERDG